MHPRTQNRALFIADYGQSKAHTVICTLLHNHNIAGECCSKSKCNELFQQNNEADFTTVILSEF